MSSQTPSHELPAGPRLVPRFSLRTLLVSMTVLSLVFAVMTAVGVVWSAALLLITCLLGAHVLGNSLGTKLRDESTRSAADDRPSAVAAVAEPPPSVPPPRLAERASLHRIAQAITLGTAAVGAELGAMLAAYTYPESSAAAVGLGALSLGVLGGLAGFAAIGFVTVARQALRQAHAAAKDPAATN